MPAEYEVCKWFFISLGVFGVVTIIVTCSDGVVSYYLDCLFEWIGERVHALTCIPKFKADINKMDKESLLAYRDEIEYYIGEAREYERSPDKLIRKLGEVNDRLNKIKLAEKYDKMAEDKWKYLTKV